jgi:hypothetical protein
MKRRIKFHTAHEIQTHLSNQKKSGLSIDAYCSRANVAVSTFCNWRKKYRFQSIQPSQVPFLQIPAASSTDRALFEVQFANKTVLKVPSGFSEDTLKTLITLLQ